MNHPAMAKDDLPHPPVGPRKAVQQPRPSPIDLPLESQKDHANVSILPGGCGVPEVFEEGRAGCWARLDFCPALDNRVAGILGCMPALDFSGASKTLI